MLIMLVSLYTVRVILNTLGVIDFGIYNVVGGVVVMFSFLSNTMASASQRFFAFDIGRNDLQQLKRTFSMTINIYVIIGLIILLLAETVGLWFLNTQMVIPPDRLEAANWIYQFSILSFLVTIMTIPFNAIIIARENMSVYAYVSIVEVILKLVVVYLLVLFTSDKLKLYAILMFATTIIISFIYFVICKRKYEETSFKFYWDKGLFKTLISYSGWNLFGTVTGMANDQGMNLLLNVFFGPAVNASRAIAYRVNMAISSFSQNFYTAVNPQIIKSYAKGDSDNMIKLIFKSSKFAYYLLLLISLPVLLEIEFVLSLWLKHIENDMIIFTNLAIIYALINSLENPLTQAARSTGRIKNYQLAVGSITLLALPISYYLLKINFKAESTMYVLIIISFSSLFARLWVLKDLINFPVSGYLRHVLFIVVLVSVISIIIPALVLFNMNDGLLRFFIVSILSILSVFGTVFIIGLTDDEKLFLKGIIVVRLKKYLNN
jgi:O-antigen/teichoic acid export membrane protein